MPIDYSKWEQLQVSDDEDVAADNPTTKMAAAPVSSGCTDPVSYTHLTLPTTMWV